MRKRLNIKLVSLLLCAILCTGLLSGCTELASQFYPGGQANTPDKPGGLYISEVVTSNSSSLVDGLLGSPDWVELYNGSDEAIDLAGYGLTKSKKDPFSYTFPSVTIEPHSYLIVFCCDKAPGTEEDQICTGFNLSKTGVTLLLSNASGSVLQELEVPELLRDVSYALDGTGVYRFFSSPTPGTENGGRSAATLSELSSTGTDGLRINEVLPVAETFSIDGQAPCGWVELYNGGSAPVALSEVYLSEDLANPSKANLPGVTLAPGEYLVLPFGDSAADNALPFKIGQGEHMLLLTDRFGSRIHQIEWDVDIFADISVGLDGNGQSVYFSTPTPGSKNDASPLKNTDFTMSEGVPPVWINEVLRKNTFSILDQDGDRSAWLELYNSTDQPLSLQGYALSDDETDPFKWMLPNVEIAPHGYVLVFLSGKDSTEGELHTSFRLGKNEPLLLLSDQNSRLIQKVPIDSESKDNISFGLSDTGEWLYFAQPTPLAANTTQGFVSIAATGDAALFGLRINEVVAVSAAKSGKPDWVELANTTGSPIDLSGYYLTDSKTDLKKWALSGTVEAGGYLVVQSALSGEEKTELSLSVSGETLYLLSPEGMVVDSFATGSLRAGISSGLDNDGTGRPASRLFFSNPTPGRANDSSSVLSGYCAQPIFSREGGYVESSFALSITTATEGASIYYTLDGSTPTERSALYTGPIEISGIRTVRAIASAPGKLVSEESVATYLLGVAHDLPIVCLSMTQSDLDYVFASTERRDIRERAGYVEYYEAGGKLGVSFPAGFRIAGNGTRLYAQRSINLYLRGGYGRSSVVYPFFEDYEIKEFKSLSLRNMGQDVSLSRIRDAYFSMAVKGMNLDYMESKFAVVYLNGKYWGLYEFKENQNEDYLASRHGVDRDVISMARSNTYVYNGTGNAGIKNLFALAKGDLANDEKFAAFCEKADSDYFMDYLIAQCFFANSDAYNQKYAGSTDGSLKWRPVFYDLDWAFMGANPKRSIMHSFFSAGGIEVGDVREDGTRWKIDTSLFYGFYKNEAWRKQFVSRYAEVLNTILTTDKLLTRFDAMVDSVRSEMPATIARWGKPSSMSSWEKEIAGLRSCLEQRRPHAIAELKSFFHLSSEEIAQLFPDG